MYPQNTARRHWLSWYTRMFNAVEGNSSFYAIPSIEHAHRWAAESAAGFKFCLKFPREISHDKALRGAHRATSDFIQVLRVLKDRDKLGPAFLQLGPNFAPDRFPILEDYLRALPADLPFAVEVRHHAWFDTGLNEQRLDGLLSELRMDKVIFDSRALFQAPPDDAIEHVSQSRKPKTPLRRTLTGSQPMLRLVGRNRIEMVDDYIDDWLPHISEWIQRGLQPIVFTHAPDDGKAPELARRFVNRLRDYHHRLPGETPISTLPTLTPKPRQLGLSFE